MHQSTSVPDVMRVTIHFEWGVVRPSQIFCLRESCGLEELLEADTRCAHNRKLKIAHPEIL